MMKMFSLSVLALLLTGCASGRCDGDSKYLKAESVPPIRGTADLQLPESPAALRIPPLSDAARAAAAEPLPAGGGRRRACLDVPPRMPALEPEPVAVEPPPVPPAPAAQ